MLSSETETISDNLVGWAVSSVNSKEILVDLDFAEPLQVSQGDTQDLLLVYTEFGNFTDFNGVRLPDFDF